MALDSLPDSGPQVAARRDDRRAGILAALLSKLGLGGASGGAASSISVSWGAFGHSAFFGGMLATKTGLVALILAGTTVAAGVGIVGNQLGVFQIAEEARDGLSLFDGFTRAKTKAQPAPVAKTTASTSLGYVADANKGQFSASPEATAAGEATRTTDAAASIAVPDHSNGVGNAASAHKIGAFKGFSGSDAAAGSSSAAQPAAKTVPASSDDSSATSRAALSSMKNPSRAAGVSVHSAQGGRKSALSQAQGVRGDQMSTLRSGNPSTQMAGATYDGAGSRAHGIGGPGSIAGGGVGAGSGAIDAGVKPNGDVSTKNLPPPPQPGPAKNITPWQWAINIAMVALGVAVIALLGAMFFKKSGNLMIAQILAGVATLAAGVATAMGVMIMTTYKQMSQGMIWTLGGGALAAFAAYQLFTMNDQDPNDVAKKGAEKPMGTIADEMKTKVPDPATKPPIVTTTT